MDPEELSLLLSVLLYLYFLLITLGENHINVMDSVVIRKYVADFEGRSSKQIKNALDNRADLLRTTSLVRLLTFIPAIALFIYGTGWFNILRSGRFAVPILGTLILIYLAGIFIPSLLMMVEYKGFIRLLFKSMAFTYLLFKPLVVPVRLIIKMLTNRDNIVENSEASDRSLEAREYILDGMEKGFFETDEQELLHSVVEFGDTVVREVMTPRVDMIYVHENTTISEMVSTVKEHNHSRYPVYGKNIDDIVGIINILELFKRWKKEDHSKSIKDLVLEPYFVPESKKVDDLLREMQLNKVQMAIVVDEYGGTAGLVTIEDLLEELVGEIQDEYEKPEEEIIKSSDDSYEVAGKTDMDEIEQLFGMVLQEDGYETAGGMIFNELGRVPDVGEKLEIKGLEITIMEVDGRKIEKVRIRKKV
jgi:CBS domain containing-hemolysin-like protein